jgi:hypothetical protein
MIVNMLVLVEEYAKSPTQETEISNSPQCFKLECSRRYFYSQDIPSNGDILMKCCTSTPDLEANQRKKRSIKEERSLEKEFNNDVGLLPNDGYHWIARHMAEGKSPHPIFRKFGELNMLNLLCMQAEIMKLRKFLVDTCKRKHEEIVEEGKDGVYPFNFANIEQEWRNRENLEEYDEIGALQWETLLDLRAKLKDYSELAFTQHTEHPL